MHFPSDIYQIIFCQLNEKDLLNCRSVCKKWNKEASNFHLWLNFYGLVEHRFNIICENDNFHNTIISLKKYSHNLYLGSLPAGVADTDYTPILVTNFEAIPNCAHIIIVFGEDTSFVLHGLFFKSGDHGRLYYVENGELILSQGIVCYFEIVEKIIAKKIYLADYGNKEIDPQLSSRLLKDLSKYANSMDPKLYIKFCKLGVIALAPLVETGLVNLLTALYEFLKI